MSDIAIRVERLSKRYRIGLGGRRYTYKTLRDTLTDAMHAPLRAIGSALRRRQPTVGNSSSATGGSRSDNSYLWALKDVSFEVKQGEALGIIGRNGAGKTTLLKILSRITEPTEGYAETYGRVGSLLEVGTGFHPELTGGENIYLSGAILGMKKGEIDRKFDEIVAFAELEKFIDTPVKHYSSGMYLRLAFAVAAHLEPEILLVDEVLAVGDIAFQKKCLGKMGEVSSGGRTVLFVSHNLQTICHLCPHAILLDDGKIVAAGPSTKVVAQYLQGYSQPTSQYYDLTSAEHVGDGRCQFSWVSIAGKNKTADAFLSVGDDLLIRYGITAKSSLKGAFVAVDIYDLHGVRIIHADTKEAGVDVQIPRGDRLTHEVCFHNLRLRPGKYVVALWLGDGDLIDCVRDAGTFEVASDTNSSNRYEPDPTYAGVYACPYEWRQTVEGSWSTES